MQNTLKIISLFVLYSLTYSQDYHNYTSPRIRYLSPNEFVEIPINLRQSLIKMKCYIPQVPINKNPHNIISANFGKKNLIDWAVLCSNKTSHTLMIFWDGSFDSPEIILQNNDNDYMQQGIGFSHMILSVDKDFILERYYLYSGTKPPEILYSGIDDGFYGKMSVVLYYYNGKWIKLTGSD